MALAEAAVEAVQGPVVVLVYWAKVQMARVAQASVAEVLVVHPDVQALTLAALMVVAGFVLRTQVL